MRRWIIYLLACVLSFGVTFFAIYKLNLIACPNLLICADGKPCIDGVPYRNAKPCIDFWNSMLAWIVGTAVLLLGITVQILRTKKESRAISSIIGGICSGAGLCALCLSGLSYFVLHL